MSSDQLALFGVGGRKREVPYQQRRPAVKPTGRSTVMQTLPAYLAHLGTKYAAKTVETYAGDVRELSLYFGWLRQLEVITTDPIAALVNARVASPLPDYLYDNEVAQLYQLASDDPRMYLVVLLFLETGMKSSEFFRLTVADVDTSDPYSPELWIRHTGKATKKDRKVALPQRFVGAYQAYRQKYQVNDELFPFTDSFASKLFAQLKARSGIEKELTPKTLRHTHVVRAYRRGEDPDAVFDRIGLAPDSRQEADEMYTRLAGRGM